MKSYHIIAVCAIAVVTADVSHLVGHGYNYDKPSAVFDIPQPVPAIQQHTSGPSNDYLPPHTHYDDALPVPIQNHEFAPQRMQHSNTPALPPIPHQEDTQPLRTPHSQYSAPTRAPVRYQGMAELLARINPNKSRAPSSDYLPPHMQLSSGGLAPGHNQISNPQSQYSIPPQAPQVHHHHRQQIPQMFSNEYLPPQSQQHPVQHTEITQPLSAPHSHGPVHQQQIDHTPSREYLPSHPAQHEDIPQSNFPSAPTPTSAPAPVHHQEISHPIQSTSNEYLPPQQQQSPPNLGSAFQPIPPTPQSEYLSPFQAPPHSNEYLPPPAQYSPPVEESLPNTVPSNDYLPPHQTPSISPPSNEYLPSEEEHHNNHHEDHHEDHHQQQHHHHHHHDEHHTDSQSDGYHYEAPSKRFLF